MARSRDRVVPRLIEDEMREAFIDYSMSVIVQRALPDVRDGLKPVHRRILYAMHEAGLLPTRAFKKSATVVGDVLGKYHPHGDSAVYDSLVRMVQDFSLRYPLVEGQGNFGSIDGDSAAAYRYTEARLSSIATEMLADIEKETVDFRPNFDDRLSEPTVLPARLPNLLVNGSSGIAVGMSTNVPPHNLREVARAAIHLLDHPDCTITDLMGFVPGPDFPTGGLIIGRKGIRDAYEKGRGRVVMRARVMLEQRRNGREQLVATEIPFMVNKTRVIEQIADLAKRGKLPDVSDLRDESDREGMRLVVELKRGGDPRKTAAAMFKQTSLQSTFGVIMLALDGGVPREFTLRELLQRFRDHRIEVVVRRSRWELDRAEAEVHILEGLLAALDNIDETVRIIRGSRTRDTAGRKLEKAFNLSQRQAEAILNMRLAKLTALEGKELRDRRNELRRRIAELTALLESPELQLAEIRRELQLLVETYGDARRTRIVDAEAALLLEEQTAEEETVIVVSRAGYVKQAPLELHRRRSAAGRMGTGLAEDDFVEAAHVVKTSDTLLVFTADGRVYPLAVDDVPETSRGRPLHALLKLGRSIRILAVLVPSAARGDTAVVHVTAEGGIKRTLLEQLANLRSVGTVAIGLKPGERLIDVRLTDGSQDLVLVTRRGRVVRFSETEVATTGRGAGTIRGIRLRDDDAVVGVAQATWEAALCAIWGDGSATRLPLDLFPVQARGGMGSVAIEDDAADLVRALDVAPGESLMAISAAGRLLRLEADEIPEQERGAAGVGVLALGAHDRVVEVARLAEPPSRGATETRDEEDLEVSETTPEGDAALLEEEVPEEDDSQLEMLA